MIRLGVRPRPLIIFWIKPPLLILVVPVALIYMDTFVDINCLILLLERVCLPVELSFLGGDLVVAYEGVVVVCVYGHCFCQCPPLVMPL